MGAELLNSNRFLILTQEYIAAVWGVMQSLGGYLVTLGEGFAGVFGPPLMALLAVLQPALQQIAEQLGVDLTEGVGFLASAFEILGAIIMGIVEVQFAILIGTMEAVAGYIDFLNEKIGGFLGRAAEASAALFGGLGGADDAAFGAEAATAGAAEAAAGDTTVNAGGNTIIVEANSDEEIARVVEEKMAEANRQAAEALTSTEV